MLVLRGEEGVNQSFPCPEVSCSGKSKLGQSRGSLFGPHPCLNWVRQAVCTDTTVGSREAGPTDSVPSTQGFFCVKGKICGTKKKLEILTCASQALLRI